MQRTNCDAQAYAIEDQQRSLTIEEAAETVLKPKQVASLLKISVKSLYRLVLKSEIPFRKIGGQYRFLKSDIERWLKGDSHE